MSRVLVTGGTGYIGSHIVAQLLTDGHSVVIADDNSNSQASVVDRLAQISGIRPTFYKISLCNEKALEELFCIEHIDVVIHLAGKKAVGESVICPTEYYRNNILSTLNLLDCMKRHDVVNLVFSSSATVYGTCHTMPLDESSPLGCTNPYGWTKFTIEQILRDFYYANPHFNIALLRYFNPVGAHKSGMIGECPIGIPNNLTPYILQVASGILPYLNVYGNDYDTKDGTGVRDYIHVCDLADGHIRVIDKLFANCGLVTYNLGTGRGYSVLEVLDAFEQAIGRPIPYKIAPRREGDIATCFACVEKAQRELGFCATRTLSDMAQDAWKWQQYYTANLT